MSEMLNFIPNTPEKPEDKMLSEQLLGLVQQTYKERLGPGQEALLKDNLDHVRQVTDNVDFIIGEIKTGQITESFVPKDSAGQPELDEELLKAMAILHDVAKVDETGKLDTFGHHDRAKLEKLLITAGTPLNDFLKNKGIDEEKIKLIVDGIQAHSRRTDFIYRKFAKDGRDLSVDLPRPEGVFEYVILSDADILTQSKLEQGVKKIVCSRLMFEGFRQQDMDGGRHSFTKTLESVIDSAQKVSEAMHFGVTKNRALTQLEEAKEFENWLKIGGKIAEIDAIEDFGEKKKRFDGFIEEFKKAQPEIEQKLAA